MSQGNVEYRKRIKTKVEGVDWVSNVDSKCQMLRQFMSMFLGIIRHLLTTNMKSSKCS